MRKTMWFKFLVSATFAHIYRKHMRWFQPKRPENDDEQRARK